MEQNDIQSCFEALGIPTNHTSVGLSNLLASSSQYKSLFVNRRLPLEGLSDGQIQLLLFTLSSLDTNNAHGSRRCGVGEREGRTYSSLVYNRHYGFSHGVGRSGDITEPQPKAVGSSAMAKLTLHLVLDAIRRGSGLEKRTACHSGILLPMCTGMSVALTLQSLKEIQVKQAKKCSNNNSSPESADKKDTTTVETTKTDDARELEQHQQQRNVVLWCRIDQKSCLKAIISAGMECVMIPTIRVEGSDEVTTDLMALKKEVKRIGSQRIVAVISTTSCFAPRVPDRVDEIAKLCQEEEICHLINNAYGLQCAKTCKLINRACTIGRVDAIVSSTDKNFLVPVGGAIVISPNQNVIEMIGKMYAGRANASPCIDLFITLLSMGLNGYKSLLKERMELYTTFQQRLSEIAVKHNERILLCPSNTISLGITLNSLANDGNKNTPLIPDKNNEARITESLDDQKATPSVEDDSKEKSATPTTKQQILNQQQEGFKQISYFGSMLFTRCVSGTRVVPQHQTKTINGITFQGFGSSTDDYGDSYLTAACAIGLTPNEMNEFFIRLDKTFVDFRKKKKT